MIGPVMRKRCAVVVSDQVGCIRVHRVTRFVSVALLRAKPAIPSTLMSTTGKIIPNKELKTIAKKQSAPKAKAVEVKRLDKAEKIAKTGVDTRVKGHLKAANKRNQGKRDSK